MTGNSNAGGGKRMWQILRIERTGRRQRKTRLMKMRGHLPAIRRTLRELDEMSGPGTLFGCGETAVTHSALPLPRERRE